MPDFIGFPRHFHYCGTWKNTVFGSKHISKRPKSPSVIYRIICKIKNALFTGFFEDWRIEIDGVLGV